MCEIYLDNCATTRVDKNAAEIAAHVMLSDYGNPSSLHKKGIDAQLVLDTARRQVSDALGCTPEELYFTSGGTESDNLAIFGASSALRRSGTTLITTGWEHSAVLEPMRELEKRGSVVKIINPAQDGHIDIREIADAVDGDTVLVSCMMVNSEVGAIADIAELAALVKRKNDKALIHCDAVQGFGKLKFSASKLGADLISVSGHKIHAPKGVGALYIKKSARILPAFFGGGQEKNIRPGTEPLPLIAAFGLAAETARENIDSNYTHVSSLREHFVKKSALIPGLCINSPGDSTPYICNVSLPEYQSEIMLHYLASKGIYVSGGSACGKGKPSHVLTAMGLERKRILGALRVSFSRYNTTDDIDAFFAALSQGMKEIRV